MHATTCDEAVDPDEIRRFYLTGFEEKIFRIAWSRLWSAFRTLSWLVIFWMISTPENNTPYTFSLG